MKKGVGRMNIALLGYGKMGKEIEKVAHEKGVAVKKIFTIENNLGSIGNTPQSLADVDVCIDFSIPTAVMENIKAVADCGKSIVLGTTGWYDKLKDVEKIVKEKKIGLLYSANFSLGMNIFYHLLAATSHLMDKYDCYDVSIQETHHKGKADSPSGTALSMGQIILQNIRRKKNVLTETSHKEINPEQLHITSNRIGYVVGQHSVIFDSEADSIEMIHTAKNRKGFALGAIMAAEWLKGKKGVFTMKDVITSL
jgi:4-hydroxy-tetrahydrodipicolinate reductase